MPHSAPSHYSGIGALKELPDSCPQGQSSQSASLLKIYAHPSQQFSGSNDLTENLASFHCSYLSKCSSLHLTKQEALDNFHCIFVPNSRAHSFFYKYVEGKAKTLNEAFYLLYNHFMTSGRRDRLVKRWNSSKLKEFRTPQNSTTMLAFEALCKTAELLQIQLGEEYQHSSLLRDTVYNSVDDEPFAKFLPITPCSTWNNLQEACTRAINVQEKQGTAPNQALNVPPHDQSSSTTPAPTVQPAFGHEVSYQQTSQQNLLARQY